MNLLVSSKDWLGYATKKLKVANISSSELDAIIILCFCLQISKIELLSNPQIMLSKSKLASANKLLSERLVGYPIAYLTKSVEFYNRSFFIDSRVLVPRPESESFINLLKTENISSLKELTDLGCGSGILGITSKFEFPHLEIEFIDISKKALEVTKINLKKSNIKAHVMLSDLLAKSQNRFEIILANLPYVPKDMPINKPASFEPKMAIFAKNNGLFYYNKMLNQLSKKPVKPKLILVECLDTQLNKLVKLFSRLGYKIVMSEGLVHMFSNDSRTHYQL